MAKLLVHLSAQISLLHLFKYHHSDLIEYYLYLYQQWFVTASLDRLFKVIGAYSSANELLKAANTHTKSIASLKLD